MTAHATQQTRGAHLQMFLQRNLGQTIHSSWWSRRLGGIHYRTRQTRCVATRTYTYRTGTYRTKSNRTNADRTHSDRTDAYRTKSNRKITNRTRADRSQPQPKPNKTPTNTKNCCITPKMVSFHTKLTIFTRKSQKISKFSRCQPPQLPFWHPPTQFLRANAVAAPYVTPQPLCVKQLQHTTRCNTPQYHLKIVRFVRRVAIDVMQQQHTIRCVNERRPPHTHFVLFVRRMGA